MRAVGTIQATLPFIILLFRPSPVRGEWGRKRRKTEEAYQEVLRRVCGYVGEEGLGGRCARRTRTRRRCSFLGKGRVSARLGWAGEKDRSGNHPGLPHQCILFPQVRVGSGGGGGEETKE